MNTQRTLKRKGPTSTPDRRRDCLWYIYICRWLFVVCLFVCLFVSLFLCFFVSLFGWLVVCLFVRWFVFVHLLSIYWLLICSELPMYVSCHLSNTPSHPPDSFAGPGEAAMLVSNLISSISLHKRRGNLGKSPCSCDGLYPLVNCHITM